MAREKKTPAQRLLEQIDKKVEQRGKAVLAELDATAEIARLTSEARAHGATMVELTQHVRRMDKRERRLKPVTRQALDTMLAVHEERRPARTTRASRQRREDGAEQAGSGRGLNLEAFR